NEGGVILLDAYDEIGPDGQRQVCEMVDMLGNCQVVLTSRPHAYRLRPLAGFAQYELQELQPSQVESLASNVCMAIAPQFGCDDYHPALQTVMRVSTGRAAEMTRNPLLL